MSAYLIVDIAEIPDAEGYAEYRKRVSPGLEAAGGRYLARGGAIEVLEGDWKPSRVVVVEFDSMAEARDWWESPGYRELKALRQRATRTHMILVNGLSGKER
jgi:uncharacterized protein (DUF1330 family)